MCHMGLMGRLNHLFKKMVKMQSPRVQCCMCAVSVMSALLGMFMLSAGVCLLLNYNFLEVDTSGLPPDLHNEQGKKVVGIILICVGVASLGLSGLVSTIFYAACSRASPTPKATEDKGQGQGRPSGQERSGRGHNGQGRYHSNGTTTSTTTPVRASPAIGVSAGGRRAGGAGVAMPNGRRGNDARGPASVTMVKDGSASYSRNSIAGARNAAAATPPGAARPYRHGKKSRHGPGRFRNSLPSHPEEVGGGEGHHLGGSRLSTSSSRRLAFPDRSGHVNHGAQLEDNDDNVTGDGVASGSADASAVTPSVVIKVDSSYLHSEAPSQTSSQDVESSSSSSASSSSSSQASRQCNGGVEGVDDISPTVTISVDANDNRNKEGEEEGGRVSWSIVSSAETVEESPEDAKKRPDSQMTTLVS